MVRISCAQCAIVATACCSLSFVVNALPSGAPVSQISDGQPQATTGAPVSQITDGQPQAPTPTKSSQTSKASSVAQSTCSAPHVNVFTVPAGFPTSLYSAYYIPPSPSQEPQPIQHDTVLNYTFPLNLTNPATIPTEDPVSGPAFRTSVRLLTEL